MPRMLLTLKSIVFSSLLIRFCLLLLLLLSPCAVAYAAPVVLEGENEPSPRDLGVTSAILYDLESNRILFEQNADQRIQPASLTKIMTMFLAFDAIHKGQVRFQTLVPISKEAAGESGSRMGIQPGEEVPLGKLLLGMAVSSGNDASYAVAELIGGSKDAFVALMNRKAQALGMHDTHFCTPNGLPNPNQYTTARDMLRMARAYLARYPWALSLHNQRILKHQAYVSWNRNPLLTQYPGCDGLKTGWVRASGYNLIITALRSKKRLLAVILGAPDALHRGVEACRLLDAGFLVTAQKEPTIEEALLHLPFDNYHLDLHKNAHEAFAAYGYVSSGKRKMRPSLQRQVRAKKKAHVSQRGSPKSRPKARTGQKKRRS